LADIRRRAGIPHCRLAGSWAGFPHRYASSQWERACCRWPGWINAGRANSPSEYRDPCPLTCPSVIALLALCVISAGGSLVSLNHRSVSRMSPKFRSPDGVSRGFMSTSFLHPNPLQQSESAKRRALSHVQFSCRNRVRIPSGTYLQAEATFLPSSRRPGPQTSLPSSLIREAG